MNEKQASKPRKSLVEVRAHLLQSLTSAPPLLDDFEQLEVTAPATWGGKG